MKKLMKNTRTTNMENALQFNSWYDDLKEESPNEKRI